MTDSFTAKLYHQIRWSPDPMERARAARMLKAIRAENRRKNIARQRRMGRTGPYLFRDSYDADDYRWHNDGVRDHLYAHLWGEGFGDEWAAERVRRMQAAGAERAVPYRPRGRPDSTEFVPLGDSNPPVVMRPRRDNRVVTSMRLSGRTDDASIQRLQAGLNASGFNGRLSYQQGESGVLLTFPRRVPYSQLKTTLRRYGYSIAQIKAY